jgi:hypothetical protein
MAHGARVTDLPLDAWEKQAKRIIKENTKLHPGLQIRGLRWLNRTDGKEVSTLIIEIDSAEHANRMTCEDVIMGYDLKLTEGGHSTETCADKSQAPLKKCAGCSGRNHTAWSKDCPARAKELQRVKAAQLSLPKLFPVATTAQFFTGSTQAESVRLSGAPQWNEDATDASKKRKLNSMGRPIGAVSKAKTLDRNMGANSTLNFTTISQSQPAPGTQDASETPANNKQAVDSIINGDMSDICES